MINTIAVLGAGVMGYGIALNFALAGYTVHLMDVAPQIRDKAFHNMRTSLEVMVEEGMHAEEEAVAALPRIHPFTDRNAACREADLVLEAMPENLELKQEMFREIGEVCKPECIFASNTSSLKLTEVCATLSEARKERCVIAHYFNPAHLIPLVEIMNHPQTPESVLEEVEAMYKRSGKVTIRVRKDINGMIANRIQAAINREALWLLEHGYCSEQDLGRAMVFGPCFRYATTDYLEIVDMGGLDIWTNVMDRLYPELCNSEKVSPVMRDKAEAGNKGWKSGKGFYEYKDDDKEKVFARFNRNLLRQLKVSKYYIY